MSASTDWAFRSETGTVEFGDVIVLDELGSAPANPTVNTKLNIYMKADKFIISFDNAGTMKYWYMDLTSTAATWTYTTSAP